MRLEKYIYQLLFQYDCVIVPNFGAFVTYPTQSVINLEENIINPPHKVVNFSSKIATNDGILQKTYAVNEKVDEQQAAVFIKNDVDSWYTILDDGKSIVIDKIGVLNKNSNGIIEFEAHTTVNFLAFGLKPLKPNLVLPQATEEIVMEENKRWSAFLAVASIIPILVGGYFYFNTPQPVQKFVDHQWSGVVLPVIKETVPNLLNSSDQEANEVVVQETIHNLPTTIVNPTEFLHVVSNQKIANDSTDQVISKYEITVVEEKQLSEDEKEVKAIIKNSKVEPEPKKVAEPKLEEKKTALAKESKSKNVVEDNSRITANPKKYQIIAASLRRKEDAERMLTTLEKDGYKNSDIVYVKGYYYYVTYESFNDKDKATTYLNNLHKKRPDAWIREQK